MIIQNVHLKTLSMLYFVSNNVFLLGVLSVKDDFFLLPYLRSKIFMRCSILEGQLFMWSPIQEG
jgi:hypothetical protein